LHAGDLEGEDVRRVLSGFITAIVIVGLTPMAEADTLPHCVNWLEPIDTTPTGVINTPPVVVGCYETFAQAIEVASGGAADLSDSITPAQLTDQLLSEATDSVTIASVVIGIEYDMINFQIESEIYTGASTCSASTSYAVAYVGDALNDDFASGRGLGGCDENRKFAASNFGGAVKVCTPNCANYGAGVANQVSSLKWQH
jgi:hypothetical protein